MIKELIRKNIQQLKPYSSARDEFKGEARLFLDANESPYPSAYNRYPDPMQEKLKARIAEIKELKTSQLFLGNGSDEALDLLIRVFCEPYAESILVAEPTYGMYAVCAQVNGVTVNRAKLDENFDLDIHSIFRAVTRTTKIIFLCSPNNPSGNLLNREKVEKVIRTFAGIVVIDEAYIDFANDAGFVSALSQYPNLVILQTFSKAMGLAGLRLGVCMASQEIIGVLNKIKYPYNIGSLTQQLALGELRNTVKRSRQVQEIIAERERVRASLAALKVVLRVYPSDSNFLLVRMRQARAVYQQLMEQGIIVRDRSLIAQCENCLRITIGTTRENEMLLNALKKL